MTLGRCFELDAEFGRKPIGRETLPAASTMVFLNTTSSRLHSRDGLAPQLAPTLSGAQTPKLKRPPDAKYSAQAKMSSRGALEVPRKPIQLMVRASSPGHRLLS
jgi:hypothetical protein